MKASEIKVGCFYSAKLSNRLTVVRVDAIRVVDNRYGNASTTRYDVTNMTTGRTLTFRSAAKFREEVQQPAVLTERLERSDKEVSIVSSMLDEGKTMVVPEAENITPEQLAESRSIYDGDGTTREERTDLMASELAVDTDKQEGEDSRPFPTLTDTSNVQNDMMNCGQLPTSDITNLSTPTSLEVISPCQSQVIASATNAKNQDQTIGTPTSLAERLAGRIATVVPQQQVKSAFKPTDEQVAIIDKAQTLGKGDVLVIEGAAGAAKTTVLVMLEQVLKGQGQYTAFNTSLVAESGKRFSKCAANTTHSLAFRAIGKRYAHRLGGNRVRSEEVARMLGIGSLKLMVGDADKILASGLLASVAMKAVKRFCQSADSEITESHFSYIDGIDLPSGDGTRTYTNNRRVREYLLPFAIKAWDDLNDPNGTLPYNADCYVKTWQLNKPVISADYVLLDEHQDTAAVMIDILKQQKALIILVGDANQSIYQWRGSVNAADAFPDADKLYLSQSFRFGEAVASVANQVLELIGTPMRVKGFDKIDSRVDELENPTAILCRTNAVAVGTVLQAIGNGKKPYLVGGGSDVISFVEAAQKLQRNQGTSHPELACFATWREVEAYVKMDEGADLKLMVSLITKFGCEPILNALRNMPDEKDADLVVCTAHKSKGRQWETVKIANDFPTLSKSGVEDFKLLYVAVTRAQFVLDISECPFFTGEDALEIIPTATMVDQPAVNVPKTTVTAFRWAKVQNQWCVRGPKGEDGNVVQVTKRDGSIANVRLGDVRYEDGDIAVYDV